MFPLLVAGTRHSYAPRLYAIVTAHFLPELQLFSRQAFIHQTKARALPYGSRRPQILRLQGLANNMSSDQPIGAPFTLASLSKPVGSTNGRVHAAGVCSISGIKKRKRTEIAVGVDGEGVSIYSVCTSHCDM